MPTSQKPRMVRKEAKGPNPYTRAGTLLYSFYETAAVRRWAGPTMEEVERRGRRKVHTRRGVRGVTFHACDAAGSRPAERRRRQKLTQHPSVIARFANHPTQDEVQAEIARVEGGKPGIIGRVKKAAKRVVGAA